MDARNPSFGLTNELVDNIADRLLRGRYEKRMPVQTLEVIRAGLISLEACRSYVIARWGERSRWARGPSSKDGPLSSAGITMRSGKLWERAQVHVARAKDLDEPEIVWRIQDGRTYETLCYATGSSGAAKQWAFTLFGWAVRPGLVVGDLRAHLHSAGGGLAASIANVGMLERINGRIRSIEEEVAQKLEAAGNLRNLHDSIAAAAAHLAG